MSEKVTFQELIDSIAEQTNNSKKFTHDFLKDLVSVINSGLERDGSVNIAGLGKFKLRRMNEREGYNPQTGEKMTIEAHNKVVFKPYKGLRELVNAPYSDEDPKMIDEDETVASQEDIEDISEEEKVSQQPPSDEPAEVTDEEEEGFIPTGPPPTVKSDVEDSEDSTEEDRDTTGDQAPWDAGEDEEKEEEVKAEKKEQEDPFGISSSEEGKEADEDVVEYRPPDEEEQESSSLDQHLDKAKKEGKQETDEAVEQEQPEPEEEEVETEPEPAEEPEPVMTSDSGSKVSRDSYIPSFKKNQTPPWIWGAAAVIGLLVIVLAIWFFSSGNGADQQAEQSIASTQTQSEEVTEQPESQTTRPATSEEESVSESSESDSQSQSQSQSGTQTPGQSTAQENASNQPQQLQQNGTVTRSVARGQTLWGLAQKEYEDPYLWPWIYDANKASIRNPDIILVGQTLSIPVPDEANYGLSATDSLEVAVGYVETYRWYKNNGQENAKYYLWAAKIYDQNVFDHITQPIDEDDLAFANRVR